MLRNPLRTRVARAAAIGITLALALAGCASAPDPEQTRDSLREVTQNPAPPMAATELDAETAPDPIVEPLECSPYLVITVRGTGEPTKGQLLSPVARGVSELLEERAQTVDVDYPAGTDVKEGATVGVRVLIDTLNVQTENCPEQEFVLLGYSQGALIVGDALVDPESRLVGATVGALMANVAERIVAIVLYGNPRFVGGEAFNAGSFDPQLNGILPRPLGSLDAYADRIVDFCVKKDFVCQGSLDLDEKAHQTYYRNGMQQEGVVFATERIAPIPRDAEKTEGEESPQPESGDEGENEEV